MSPIQALNNLVLAAQQAKLTMNEHAICQESQKVLEKFIVENTEKVELKP